MAFSMHPFDVDSWAKNGDDAQLESVLGLVAQVSEQDPKELAEDVRSMSGPVRNRMHDYPGTSLLEAWEAEALTHEDFTPTPKHPHNIWIIRTCVVLGVGVSGEACKGGAGGAPCSRRPPARARGRPSPR